MRHIKKILRACSFIIVALFQLESVVANDQIDSTRTDDTVKNQIRVTRLQSYYDQNKKSISVSSFEYIRKLANKSTIIGRVNYSDRNDVKGFQFETETYLTHNAFYYSFGSVSIANNSASPGFKAAYSLNRNFKKGWEGELGYRYLRAEEMDIHSAIWGVGKYLGNYWLNLKGYIISDAGDLHQSYRFTSRYYLNDQLDYVTFIASTGTSPDDRSRNFDYSNFGSFISKSIALGYKKSFKRNFTGSFTSAWNNQKIGNDDYLNQFDVYLSFSKSF